MSALILNMQVVAQLARVLSDVLRLYAYVVARWFVEGEESARDGYTGARVGVECVRLFLRNLLYEADRAL